MNFVISMKYAVAINRMNNIFKKHETGKKLYTRMSTGKGNHAFYIVINARNVL